MSSFQPLLRKEIPMDALLRRAALALGLVTLLSVTACGGVASAGTDTSTQSVQGIATPSSVSVVTAKNAN
jgi:hypothetical protein